MPKGFKYIEKRVADQKKWHSDKAKWNKRQHYTTEIVMLVAGAVIPIVNVLSGSPDPVVRVLSASLAAVIVIAVGISKLFKFQENWLNFRMVSEVLEAEKELYSHSAGDYDIGEDEKRKKLFVERIEGILASITQQFIALQRAKQDKTQKSRPAKSATQS